MLPDCVPRESWDGYVEMRRKIKKPMTDRAVKLAIGVLEGLVARGQDAGAVLDQSTFYGWQGLFEVRVERRKEARAGKVDQLGKAGQATANNAMDWLEE